MKVIPPSKCPIRFLLIHKTRSTQFTGIEISRHNSRVFHAASTMLPIWSALGKFNASQEKLANCCFSALSVVAHCVFGKCDERVMRWPCGEWSCWDKSNGGEKMNWPMPSMNKAICNKVILLREMWFDIKESVFVGDEWERVRQRERKRVYDWHLIRNMADVDWHVVCVWLVNQYESN